MTSPPAAREAAHHTGESLDTSSVTIHQPRLRRSRVQIAILLAVMAVGGTGAAFLFSSVGDTEPVVAVAEPVSRGEVVTEASLTTAQLNADEAITPVPAGRMSELVGQRAAVDLSAGSLVTAGSVTAAMRPQSGESLVPLAVPADRVPNEELLPGDTVDVVLTPPEGAENVDAPDEDITATVLSVGSADANGMHVVDVIARPEDANALAARSASGRIGLVLNSREGD